MRYSRLLAAVGALVALSANARAQEGRTYCVTPRDTSWRPVNFGFDMEISSRRRLGVAVYAYPIVRNVVRGSPADSAGLHDGDELRAINRHDYVLEHDSARVKGPGVPTRLTIRRGDSTYERTIVGLPAKPCPDSLKRR